MVSTDGPLQVRSRRGWNMTPQLGFLAALPMRAVLDGELVAFDVGGKPDFPLVCEAVLHRHSEIPLTFMAFDVLSRDGRDLRGCRYRERRSVLKGLGLAGPRWRVPEAFDDGPALWAAVCENELEGVVAKRLHEPYLSGERGWVKVKNRAYWRCEAQRGRSAAGLA
jgi:bifunctional non-homologous end joining protein LigD